MAVLIIAASKSDVGIMEKAAAALEKSGVEHKMRVCSAHRTPEMLDKIIEEVEYDAIIAAAGLAAALPGVVAAKTTAPVIGVPLMGAFEGLDALLSIIQMPPGIPVLTTGVNNAEEAAMAAAMIAKNKMKRINIVDHGNAQKAVDKATEALKELEIEHSLGNKVLETAINICFISINEKEGMISESAIVINCPTAEKETANDAVKLLQLTKKGIWVGLNRGENAAVAAAEIMRKNDKLKEYRWGMRLKVEEADKEVNER
ncbi:AIR carboxylase family protein [Candidatus Woesearchaeota archaeon]|nr:AIR carboxylase family protein [Candidatus Woesearchaeota archaeon]